MADDISTIGLLRIPLESEGFPTPIHDPTITGLLDYFRFWIRDGLGQKIGDPNDTQGDPLPAEHVFDYDPADNWVRNINSDSDPAIPALYLWQSAPSVIQDYSLIHEMRVRKLRLMYVCKPIFGPEGTPNFAGLGAAVDAILLKSWSRGRHPEYGYDGAPPGTKISTSLNLIGWKYDGGQPGAFVPVPGTSPRIGGPSGGNVSDFYPGLLAHVTVYERVDQEELGDDYGPQDIPIDMRVNDPADVNGPLSLLDRTLESPWESPDE